MSINENECWCRLVIKQRRELKEEDNVKRVKFISLMLILVLGLLGVGYAAWTDALTVEGTVDTGTLKVNVSGSGSGNGNYEVVEDVSYDSQGNTVTFEISNLYPREGDDGEDYAWVSITVKNDGTIPAKVTGITVSSNDDIVNDHLRFKRGDTWDMTLTGLEDHLKNALINAVLEPAEEHEITTWFYLNEYAENAEQEQSGSFMVTFEFGQWNL